MRRLEPDAGQESVWDYPRPPAIRSDSRLVEVIVDGRVLAATRHALKVLETSHPPAFYLPPNDVDLALLEIAAGSSMCEWKGVATYWDVVSDRRIARAGWSYDTPTDPFAQLTGFFSFYPARVECRVDGHVVERQEGDFYGGWITPEVVGPFKGAPGTWSW